MAAVYVGGWTDGDPGTITAAQGVLAWEPPHRVLFTWQITGMWQFDPDPAHASEIEARFRADGPQQTIVEVEHRHRERLVAGQSVHNAINGGGGWELLLAGYAKTAGTQS